MSIKTQDEYKGLLVEALASLKGKTVLVEGKNDREALSLFGILHVKAINGKGLYEFCQELSKEERVVILTDFDPEGENIAKKLERQLQGLGVPIDREMRSKLRPLFIKNNLNTIQGLRNLV